MGQFLPRTLVAIAAFFVLSALTLGSQKNTDLENIGNRDINKGDFKPMMMSYENFFQRMTAHAPARQTPVLFSAHPPYEDRAAKTAENIRKYLPARQQNLLTTTEFQDARARLIGRKTP